MNGRSPTGLPGDKVIVKGVDKIPAGTPVTLAAPSSQEEKHHEFRFYPAAYIPNHKPRLTLDGPDHAEFLYSSAQLRLGRRNFHQLGGFARHILAAGGAVPKCGSTTDSDRGNLSRRLRRSHQRQRHQPDRRRTQRREGSLLRIQQQQLGRGRSQRHFRAGHQS